MKVLEAMLVAALSAVMGFLLIYAYNDCVPIKDKQQHEESHVQVGITVTFR